MAALEGRAQSSQYNQYMNQIESGENFISADMINYPGGGPHKLTGKNRVMNPRLANQMQRASTSHFGMA